MSERRQHLIWAAFLTALILLVYAQVGNHGFLDYDDGAYVTGNPVVQRGITPEGIAWAFQRSHSANWHPMTWISHMVDIELFGNDPRWHHWVNTGIHIANTILLFLVSSAASGKIIGSALVAAMFGLHPLHVESVAWISERKDLLSALFWLLATGAYVGFCRRGGAARYGLSLLLFSLGLLSKPMVVTLPVALLLMDYWPLGRLGREKKGPDPDRRRRATRILVEKLPFLALAGIAGVITYTSQEEAGAVTLQLVRIPTRLSNAVLSYAGYLLKTFWPFSLSVFYPHPWSVLETIPLWKILMSSTLVSCVTIVFFRRRKTEPYLIFGWLWYLVTLVPAIGLVQVGAQSMADRYTYIPLIGIFVAIVWGARDTAVKLRIRRELVGATAVAAVACFAIASWVQASYWRNDITLFQHALEVTEKNWMAHANLAKQYRKVQRVPEAIAHLEEMLRINPYFPDAQYDLGTLYLGQGRRAEAISRYRIAAEISPDPFPPLLQLARIYQEEGMTEEAKHSLGRALSLRPRDSDAVFLSSIVFPQIRR